MEIRTRFAPSPTGYMHIGNLRTALYEYLIAKANGGKFILRIEDTDQERYVEGAVDVIYNTLKITGLIHDEGPDVGGDYGPYVQSERRGMYMQYAQELVKKGEAYYCFCTKERLDGLKEKNGEGDAFSHYDRHCLSLSQDEINNNLKSGMPYVIRQKMPTEGKTTFEDAVYGTISVDKSELDDQILIKSDGMPTYNFANVVDDHLMKITHVVRGSEYLSSTPKYNLLYDAFGWDAPTYVHLPPVMKDAHHKLSKRNGDASFQDLIEKGYISDAIINYIALLGWSPSDNTEIFTLEELKKSFSISGLSKSPSIFDIQKLTWMNGEYMKAMEFDRFFEMAEPHIRKVITKDLDLEKIAAMVKTRIEIFPDIADHIDFFEALPEYDPEMYVHKKMKTNKETALTVLTEVLPILEAQEDFSNDALYAALSAYVAEKGYKTGFVMWPIRTAVSGKQMTPAGATEIMEVLGREESIARIQTGIELLSRQ